MIQFTTQNNDNKIRYFTLHGSKFFTHNQESANRFYSYKVHTTRDSMFID